MVDNDSRDRSCDYVREHFPEIKLVLSDYNRGFAGGNNYGISHCAGEYLYFLNNDTRLDPNALMELTKAAKTNPGFRIFSSFLINYLEPHLADSAGDTVYTIGVPHGFSGYPVDLFTKAREVTAACAGAALYSRKVLDEIGAFDEEFFLIFEDMDLAFRARHAGERILFVPASKVYHKGSASIGGKTSPTSLYYCERNIWPFLIKNFPTPILIGMLPGLVLIKCMRFMNAIRFGALPVFFKATFSSIGMIPSMVSKRKVILGSSKLSSAEFRKLLRKGWLRERLAMRRGDFSIRL